MPKKEKRARNRLYLQPGNELPAGYKPQRYFALPAEDWRRTIGLSLFGAVFLFLFGWLSLTIVISLTPNLIDPIIALSSQPLFFVIAGNLAGAASLYACHEGVHALLLYYYTRARPQVKLRLYYFQLSAPGWYLPRLQSIIVCLGPFVILNVAGLLLLWIIPPPLAPALLFGLAMNAASAAGDCLLALWIIRQPRQTLFEYFGDALSAYNLS